MNKFFLKRVILGVLPAVIVGVAFLLTTSQTNGTSWLSVGPGGGGWLVDVEYSQVRNELFVGLDCGGVRVSRNSGSTWEISTVGLGSFYGSEVEDVFIHPVNSRLILLAAWTGIYRSEDAGKTWNEVMNVGDGTSLRVNTFASDPRNSNVLYAASGTTRQSLGFVNVEGNTDAPGVLWRSENGGKAWKELYRFDRNLSVYSILVNGGRLRASSDNAILLATNKGLWKSTNGGKSFVVKNVGLPENLRQAGKSVRNSNLVWTTVMYDGIYESGNFGDSWKRIGPKEKHAYVHMAVDPNLDKKHADTILVSAQDWFGVGGVWQGARNASGEFGWKRMYPSQNTQGAWNTHEAWSAGAVTVGYTSQGKRVIFLVAPGASLLKSTDNGSSWTAIQSQKDSQGTWRGNGFELMILADGAIDPRNGAIYFSYIDMGTFKSIDGGYSWKQLKAGGHFAGGNPESTGVNPLTGDVYISVADGRILRSQDGGDTFADDFGALAYQFAFNAGGVVYAATSGGVVQRVAGGQWVAVGDLKNANTVVVSHNVLYAGNVEGVWRFEGGKWNKILNMVNIRAGGVAIHPASDEMLVLTNKGIALKDSKGLVKDVLKGEFEALKSVGSTVYVKSRVDGIWRSSDFGQSWKNVTDGAYQDGYERGLVIDPINPNIVYYGTKCMGVFKRDFSK